MKSSLEISEPKLAPPGAGIPFPQKLVLRFFVRPLIAQRTPWEESEKRFLKITEKIEAELAGLSPAQLEKRVLIAPLTGLEDSSRNWSIAMTLDHLWIVGSQIFLLVRALDAGLVPPGEADTAKVKPSGALATSEALSRFREFSQADFPALLPSLSRKKSPARFRHPWFGRMTAQGWYWMLATHQAVHLAQIRAIKKGL